MRDWPNYEASDVGRVRSLGRMVQNRYSPYWQAGRILAQGGRPGSYRHVRLYRDGEDATLDVHVIVLEAFAGAPLPGQVARHGPLGIAVNWWPENLCWGSQADNVGPDRMRDGTLLCGEQIYGARLTASIVAECRHRYRTGEAVMALAAEFDVTRGAMHRAVTGVTWRHVR